MSELKRGRLSQGERDAIREGVRAGRHPQVIADALRRSLDTVQAFIRDFCPPDPDPADRDRAAAASDLKGSMAWKYLCEEFRPDEVKYFEESYLKYKTQFKEDVYASEESQLFKLIKLEILMHRNMVAQRRGEQEVERLERDRDRMVGSGARSEEDDARLMNLDTTITTKRAELQALTNQHDKLGRAHDDIMKSLKATREQRISKATENRRSFLDLIRQLDADEKAAEADRLVDQMAKVGRKELARLGRVHVYADGAHDRPILNAETVQGPPLPQKDED